MAVIVSRANKALAVPAFPGVVSMFPNAPAIPDTPNVVIPHGMRETLMLRHLGFKVPNPMLLYYDWVGGHPFASQTATCIMLTENMHAYVLNDMGCVDAATEYLSDDGWHKIDMYKSGKVAQYHPEDGSIEFVYPDKYVKLPCEEMIHFKTTRGIDQLLSPEHRVLLDCGLVVSAENIEQVYSAKIARLIKFRTTFSVRGTRGIDLSEAQIRVQIACNADGTEHGKWTTIRIKKERKIKRLRILLANAHISYTERPATPVGFRRFTFQAPAAKGFHSWWWEANGLQLGIVADEVVHWDGSARKAKGRGFYSCSKSDADFVQYAYAASGCRASLNTTARKDHIEYTVHAAHGKTVAGLYGQNGKQWRQNIWREPPSDSFKYCFVVPSTFLLLRRNGCIFATGNTGKTKTALWAWDYLNKCGLTKKLLVVAPLSTLKFVWQSEAFGTLPGRKVQVLHGSRQQRLDGLAQDADIYVINHDGLRVIVDELFIRADITALVIDELTVYRNNSDRSKLMRKFAQRFQIVWGMTGAPMPNEPPDVWAQGKIVTPNTVPKFKRQAQDMLMVRVGSYGPNGPPIWKPKPDAIENAFKMLQPAVRYKLDDVVELPPLISRVVDVDMSAEQKKTYDKVLKECIALIHNKQITALNAGVAMGKLLQIAGGWCYSNAPEFVQLDAAPRIAALLDLINSSDRKVIVFVPYRHMIEGLSKILSEPKTAIDHCVVHGDTPNKEDFFNLFQNTDKYKTMLAHPKCVHHGLTLTAADTSIWYLPITSLEVYIQANLRIRRIGQEHKQQIIHLQAAPVEKRVYGLLRDHKVVQDKLLGLFEDATGENNDPL